MSAQCTDIGEAPIFSTKAHVFHIDPKTKRSWIPASSHAVSVSFFFDACRNLYRIISVEGSKAVINSTITAPMTFTKTSQKFGQWSDIRANTVYGLGFQTEADLNQFIDKFQEVKEKTRLIQQKQNETTSAGSPSSTLVRANVATASASTSASAASSSVQISASPSGSQQSTSSTSSTVATGGAGASGVVAASISALEPSSEDSPKHRPANQLPQTTIEAQLRYENDRLKLALAQSSANAKKWEIELQTLKNNNARLTCALQESTANVEEWKRQLQSLKDENSKMRCRVLEFEAQQGNQEALTELGAEINSLKAKNNLLMAELQLKEKELEHLRSGDQSERMKSTIAENDVLRISILQLRDQVENSLMMGKLPVLDQISELLETHASDLRNLHAEMLTLLPIPPPQSHRSK